MGTSLRKCRLAAGSLMLLGCCAFAWAPAWADDGAAALPDLKRLSVEELSNLEVSSVSRTPEAVSGAAAAIYVITGEDVRRSGSTTLAEILRQAPNLQVARIDAGDYVVSARGFSNTVSNKLLVLVDGRTVYTPLYSGVFWDLQNVVPADIDRVEVISGPGGTLWGSNAVNGVINVVSRDSSATQGAMLRLSGGNADVSGVAQYGGAIGDAFTYRVYGSGLRQGHTLTSAQLSGQDSWDLYQGGFRSDWKADADKITLQGDLQRGDNRPTVGTHIALNGGNVLGRWQHQLDTDSAVEVQAY